MNRRSMLAWLFREVWRIRRGIVLIYLTIVFTDILAVAGFALGLRFLVQEATSRDLSGALLGAALVAVCWTVSTIGTSARANLGYLLAEALSVETDDHILRTVAGRDDLEHLERPEYVDRISLVTGRGDVIARSSWLLVEVAATVVRPTVVLVILAAIAPVLLLLAALLIPALALPRHGQKRIHRATLETAEDARRAEHLHSLLTEPGPGMEIRIAGAERALRDRASHAWHQVTQCQERASWAAAGLSIAGWTLFAVAYGAALLLVVRSALAGETAPGDVLVLVSLTAALRTQAEGMVSAVRQVAGGMQLMDHYVQLVTVTGSQARASSAPAAVGDDAAPPAVPERLRDGITLRGVSFRYHGTSAAVLRDIDLDLPAGATVAIVGEHGCGKTTLVKLLCKLYGPTAGAITVDGVELGRLSTPDWRKRLTAGFQDHARFAFLAHETVGVGQLTALDDRMRIEQAVRDGGATDVIAGLPSGLDTQLGTEFDGVDLSGGQWQRLALSRAGMRAAPLLCVLDEPTASLDARAEYAAYRHQMRLARRWGAAHGTVTLIISHRFWTVRMADRIVVLAGGAIAEQGTHEELMALGGSYAGLYHLQAASYGHIGGSLATPPPAPTSHRSREAP
ncbi:ABC transporter ATP-binding protein [Streptomyces sp. 8N706]|uniref:ABC transporter ATP-binding protein n=1 Tax=Streptomyces sp. 8N706 TaxID=3457416 RepID=UPI003FD197EB